MQTVSHCDYCHKELSQKVGEFKQFITVQISAGTLQCCGECGRTEELGEVTYYFDSMECFREFWRRGTP